MIRVRCKLLKKLPIGRTFNSRNSFKEIINDVFVYVSEDCLHDLIYWRLHPKLFLYWKITVSMFAMMTPSQND